MENLCGERKLFRRHKWLLCLSASKESLCLCIILCACVCKRVGNRGEPERLALGGGCVEVVHLSLQGPDRNWQKYRREKVIDAED